MIVNMVKKIFQITAIVVFSGLVGMALMALVYLLPTDRIRSHVKESLPVLEQEKEYFYVTRDIEGSRFDNYTDTICLNEALVGAKDTDNLIKCILSGYIFQFEGDTWDKPMPAEKLENVVTEPEKAVLSSLLVRFFNGYETVLKPLLMVASYGQIREFHMYMCLFLTLFLFGLMVKKKLQSMILPVVISILYIRPLTVALVMTFVGFYYCMVIPCIIMLLMKKETLQKRAWILFTFTGAAVFYFNMNYFQLLSFGMPLLFYFMITGVPANPLQLIKKNLDYFVAWFAGYAGMMGFKWLAYAIAIDSTIFGKMLAKALARSSTDKGSRLEGILLNIHEGCGNMWWNTAEVIFIAASLIVLLYSLKKREKRAGLPNLASEILLLLIMLAFPIVRYAILCNHVTVHYWATYRILMMPILALNLFITRMNCRDELVKD